MKYAQLALQTHRDTPAQARSAGQAFLIRAGYLSHSGDLLPLAQRALQRLRSASANPHFLAGLALPFWGETDIFYPTAVGDSEILHCPACGFTARLELATAKKTACAPEEAPAALQKIPTPDCPTIEALAAFLRIPAQQTAKALMYLRPSDGQFIFIVIRGDQTLSAAKLTALLGETRLATEAEIRAVGAVPGYASPLGVHNALIVVDDLIPTSPNLAAGANEDGYHLINVNYGRDYRAELIADLTLAAAGDPCAACGAPLTAHKAWQLAIAGVFDYPNLLLALAETHHDDKGLSLPAAAAPFDIYLMHVPGKTLDTLPAAQELYRTLSAAGFEVLFDDRNERAGVKFNDADLIGCPTRLTLGERGLQNGLVELKQRREAEVRSIPLDEIMGFLRQ